MEIVFTSLCPYLEVYDMRTSVAFYCENLGFELAYHSPFYAEGEFHFCQLRRDGIELMLNTAYDEGERPPDPDPRRMAAHRDTCLYFACPDVNAAYQELLAEGLPVKPPKVAPYGMKQLYFRDPDGYGICLQCPVQV